MEKKFLPAKKRAIYIDYFVDSDGTINPDCCFHLVLEITIDAKGKVTGSAGPIMMSPTCAKKAAELEAGNTNQPGWK